MRARFHGGVLSVCVLLASALVARAEGLDNRVQILASHDSPVQSIALSPNGKGLFAGWGDGTLESFDRGTGKKLRVFENHAGDVRCLAVSPDGKTLAVGSTEKAISLCDTATGVETRRLDELDFDSHGYETIIFTADGKNIITSASHSSECAIQRWDFATGKEEHDYEDIDLASAVNVRLSADGKTILGGTFRGEVVAWNLKTGKEKRCRNFDGISGWVTLSPHQSRVLVRGTNSSDVDLVNVATGKSVRKFSMERIPREGIAMVAFSADGKQFVSGGGGTVRVWNVKTGDAVHTLRVEGDVETAMFSSDGRQVIIGTHEGQLMVWNLIAEEPAAAAGTQPDQAQHALMVPTREIEFSSPVRSLAITPDGKTLYAAWGWGNLESFELGSGKKLGAFEKQTMEVDCLTVSPDGQMLASGLAYGDVKLWDTTTGKEIRTFKFGDDILALAFTADSKKLLFSDTGQDWSTQIWDVQTGTKDLYLHGAQASCVSLSKDGGSIVSAGNGGVSVWDVQTRKQTRELKVEYDSATYNNSPGAILPDKSGALLVHKSDVEMMDLSMGKVRRSFRGVKDGHEHITVLAISGDGKRFVSGGFIPGDSRGFVHLWDMEKGDLIDTLRVDGAVQAVLFTPDGKQVVAGGDGNKAVIWTPASAEHTAEPVPK